HWKLLGIRAFISSSNRPYGFTCSQISGMSAPASSRRNRVPRFGIDPGEPPEVAEVHRRDRHDVAGTSEDGRLRRQDTIGVERVAVRGGQAGLADVRPELGR